ncbi:hypothetical protein FXE74_18835 [Vibrio cholerae]|nr:hypothetical protein FXE74_18835 [Vibrio cholerae]
MKKPLQQQLQLAQLMEPLLIKIRDIVTMKNLLKLHALAPTQYGMKKRVVVRVRAYHRWQAAMICR